VSFRCPPQAYLSCSPALRARTAQQLSLCLAVGRPLSPFASKNAGATLADRDEYAIALSPDLFGAHLRYNRDTMHTVYEAAGGREGS